MRSAPPAALAIGLVLLMGWVVPEQASARIVRDGHTAPANLAVEAGGLRPAKNRPTPFPYSLIGALAIGDRWAGSCGGWPGPLFSPFPPEQNGFDGGFHLLPFSRPFAIQPPPWVR